tara:strand:- start:212 stop:589 length:378 start_codon:yes stop_codon:yes gene_type:complete
LAGISFVLLDVKADRVVMSKGMTIPIKKRNNVYAELAAISLALKECLPLVDEDTTFRICSDCEPALEIAAGTRPVRTSKMRSITEEVDALLDEYPCDIHFQWIKSHSNHPMNDFADMIAYHHARG